jgi:aspartate/tyrosine/aromatic aminotransferase
VASVEAVLKDPAHHRVAPVASPRGWESELRDMVSRMKALRALLASRLQARRPDNDFSWLTRQRGMFSLLGIDAAAIVALRDRHHVYVPPDGRINIAGVSEANVDRVADSIVSVLGS